MKVTFTQMNMAAIGCYAISAASGKIFEKKGSFKAANVCIASWMLGNVILLTGEILVIMDKIDY